MRVPPNPGPNCMSIASFLLYLDAKRSALRVPNMKKISLVTWAKITVTKGSCDDPGKEICNHNLLAFYVCCTQPNVFLGSQQPNLNYQLAQPGGECPNLPVDVLDRHNIVQTNNHVFCS